MSGFSVWGALVIPSAARVPIHFDLHGQPDGFGGKWVALLPLPLIAALALSVLWVAKNQLRGSARAIAAIAVASTAVHAAIHCLMVAVAMGRSLDVALGGLLAQSMLLMITGNYLPTTRRNALIGIRVPWTLRSDEIWRRTHAVGGRWFIALGAMTLCATLVSVTTGHIVLVAGVLLLALGLTIYSYRLSRKISGSA
jgi:uncharacterized membrane protein